MKASVYIATSLDGFIARADGELDWLTGGDGGEPGEDYGYQEFMNSVDYLVMGRNTYEKVLTFGGWPYTGTPVVVMTSRPLNIPAELAGAVEGMSGSAEEVARRLEERGAQHVYVDGGRTIQGFLAAGLIQQLIVTRVPVLIGDGIPLFGPLPRDVRLRHVETRAFASGLVQSRYEVVNPAR